MTPTVYDTIKNKMHHYKRSGAKTYRRKQVSRLISMINDIAEHEKREHSENILNEIGRRQVIGYWRRHKNESNKTRLEKWRILSLLFEQLGKPMPPKPKQP